MDRVAREAALFFGSDERELRLFIAETIYYPRSLSRNVPDLISEASTICDCPSCVSMTTPHRLQALTATHGVYDSERAALRNEMPGFRSRRAAAARVRAVWQAPCLKPYRLRSQIAHTLRFIRRAVARAHE